VVAWGVEKTRLADPASFCRGLLGGTFLAPIGAVVSHPVEEGFFEADIFTGLFAANPFVLQDLFAFCKEVTVETRVLY